MRLLLLFAIAYSIFLVIEPLILEAKRWKPQSAAAPTGDDQRSDAPTLSWTDDTALQPTTIKSTAHTDTTNDVIIDSIIESTYPLRVAIYPSQFLDLRTRPGLSEDLVSAESIAAVLFAEMSTIPELEVYDRTDLDRIFDEKQLQSVHTSAGASSSIKRVTPANFVLSGELTKTDDGADFYIQIVHAKTAEILYANRVPWQVSDTVATVRSVVDDLKLYLANFPSNRTLNSDRNDSHLEWGSLAVGRISAIGERQVPTVAAGQFHQRLMNTLEQDTDAQLLARTHLTPLLLERDLRYFQNPGKTASEMRPTIDDFVHGYYDVNSDGTEPIVLYLYVENRYYGRRLHVITAQNWSDLHEQTLDRLKQILTRTKISDNHRSSAEQLFKAATVQLKKEATGKSYVRMESMQDKLNAAVLYQHYHASSDVREKLEKAIARNPYHAPTLKAMVHLAVNAGQRAVAKTHLEQLFRADRPNNDMIRYIDHRLGPQSPASLFADILPASKIAPVMAALERDGYLNPYARVETTLNSWAVERLRSRPLTAPLQWTNKKERRQIFAKLLESSGVFSEWRTESINHQMIGELEGDFNTYFESVNLHNFKILKDISTNGSYDAASVLSGVKDRFSSAVWLDDYNALAKSQLAATLCHRALNQCEVGNSVHQVIVEQARRAHFQGGGGWFVDISDDKLQSDALLFMSAHALNQVETAPLSNFFEASLDALDYYFDRSKRRIKDAEKRLDEAGTDEHLQQWLTLIEADIDLQCQRIRKRRDVRSNTDSFAIAALARRAMTDADVAKARDQIHQRFLEKYPSAYPALFFNVKPDVSTLIARDQIAVIDFVLSNLDEQILFQKPGKIVETFYQRHRSQFTDSEHANILEIFQRHYPVNSINFLDHATYLLKSRNYQDAYNLVAKYQFNEFILEGMESATLNGSYHLVKDNKSLLTYRHQKNPAIAFQFQSGNFGSEGLYEAKRRTQRIWKYSLEGKRRGTQYSENLDAEGVFEPLKNVDGLSGRMVRAGGNWKSASQLPSTTPNLLADKAVPPELNILIAGEPVEERKDDVVSTAELHQLGSNIVISGDWALVSFNSKNVRGSIKPRHLTRRTPQERSGYALVDALFHAGYIDASGHSPDIKHYIMRKRIFADDRFTEDEQRRLSSGFLESGDVNNAGSVKVFQRIDDEWVRHSELIPIDPKDEQRFGLAMGIYESNAYICDAQKGLHHYRFSGSQWQHQSTIDVSCHDLKLNDKWLVVGSLRTVDLYEVHAAGVRHHSTTSVYDIPHECIRNRYREGPIGKGFALGDGALFLQGADCVAVLTIGDEQLSLNNVLNISETGALGKSMTVIGNTLIVVAGDHGTERQAAFGGRGVVGIYSIQDNVAVLEKLLQPKNPKIQGIRNQLTVETLSGDAVRLHIAARDLQYQFDLTNFNQ